MKKLLLVLPDFHEITNIIVSEFKKKYDVQIIIVNEDEFVRNRIFSKYLIAVRNYFRSSRIVSNILTNLIYNRLHNELSLFKQDFDLLVVIKGVYFRADQIEKINARKKILYVWDKIDRFKYTLKLFDSFDSVYSYDKVDANVYNISYLPMFVSEHYNTIEVHDNYGVVFIGEYTKYRCNLLRSIAHKLNDQNINYSFYLVSNTNVEDCEFHTRKNMTFENFIQYLAGSSVVLDLSRNGEQCITERTAYANFYNKPLYNDSIEDFSDWFSKFLGNNLDSYLDKHTYLTLENWLDRLVDDHD